MTLPDAILIDPKVADVKGCWSIWRTFPEVWDGVNPLCCSRSGASGAAGGLLAAARAATHAVTDSSGAIDSVCDGSFVGGPGSTPADR